MEETALTIQDTKELRRTAIGEGVAVATTALTALSYGLFSAAAWAHGNIIAGSGLAVLCGGAWLLHRRFLGSYRRMRDAHHRCPAFPAARALSGPRP